MQTTDSVTVRAPTAFRTIAVIGVKVGKYVKNCATGDVGVVITKNAAYRGMISAKIATDCRAEASLIDGTAAPTATNSPDASSTPPTSSSAPVTIRQGSTVSPPSCDDTNGRATSSPTRPGTTNTLTCTKPTSSIAMTLPRIRSPAVTVVRIISEIRFSFSSTTTVTIRAASRMTSPKNAATNRKGGTTDSQPGATRPSA
jgi:hypothetical protein